MKKDFAELYKTTIYHLGGIMYVPHYRNKNVYVAPGYGRFNVTTYSAKMLEEAGAIAGFKMMLQRAEHGVVTPQTP